MCCAAWSAATPPQDHSVTFRADLPPGPPGDPPRVRHSVSAETREDALAVRGARAKTVLADGRKLTLYVPSENRATQMAMKEADDLRTPFAFLLGRLKFDEEFETLETSSEFQPLESGNVVVRAVPKRLPERVEWIVFEVTAKLEIRRLIFEEPGQIQTEFRFADEEANPALAQSLFYFQPVPGTELIQQQ